MSDISANITAKETVKVNIAAGVSRDADTVDDKHASELEPAITEGTVYQCWKGNKSWQTTPYVDVRDYASFSVAIDAIGASEKTLLIPNEQAVSADKTVPANVTIKFLQGGSLNIADTKTVTINGHVEASLYQIFKWAGTGKVSFGSGAVKEVYPEWWGAKGDGVTDDYIAIQAAIVAAGSLGMVYFGGHTYAYGTYLNIPGHVTVQGSGIGATVLLYTGADAYAIRVIDHYSNLSSFTIQQAVDRITDRAGIYVGGMHNVFRDIYTVGFRIGVKMEGDAVGCAYNNYFNLTFAQNFYDYYLTAKNAGFCNANTVFGGLATASADVGSIGIYIVHYAAHELNGNYFIGTSIEVPLIGVFCDALSNGFLNCRFECGGKDIWFGANALANSVIGDRWLDVDDDSGGLKQYVHITGGIDVSTYFSVLNVKVVGPRVVDARCDDAINSGDATTDGVIDALRDAMIAHGLVAAA